MSTRTYRGVVRDGVIVLDEKTPLAEGAEVVVTQVAPARGSPAAVLAAVEAAPRVPNEWVDELEQFIAEGRRPPMNRDPLAEENQRQERRLMPAASLDTNAISDLMRDHPQVKANAANHSGLIVTSAVAVGEIRYGLSRLPPGKKRNDLETSALRILSAIAIESITEGIGDGYGRLKASLESQGLNLDDNDLWIAATALAAGHLLVTRNRIFAQVPGLQVVDWSV